MSHHLCPPPFAYFGGKTSLATRIAGLLPPHDHYVEPYAGSLAVLLAKPPSRQETANDLDGELVNFFRMLRDQPGELIRVCALTPHSRAEYADCSGPKPDGIDDDDVERARRLWVRLTQGRGRTPSNAGWWYDATAARGATTVQYLAGYIGRMAPVAARLAQVTLECLPALDIIGKYGAHTGNLLYVDPPYLGETRHARDRYVHEMKGEAEHRELAAALVSCRSAVVLSGYDSPLYRELYAGWDRATIETASGNAKGDRSRTEVLWSNRSLVLASSLFDGVEGGDA